MNTYTRKKPLKVNNKYKSQSEYEDIVYAKIVKKEKDSEKIYIDPVGIPTIGVGSSLVIKKNINGNTVYAPYDQHVKDFNLSPMDQNLLNKAVTRLNQNATKQEMDAEFDKKFQTIATSDKMKEIALRDYKKSEEKVKNTITAEATKLGMSQSEINETLENFSNSESMYALADFHYNTGATTPKAISKFLQGDSEGAYKEISFERNVGGKIDDSLGGISTRRQEQAKAFVGISDSQKDGWEQDFKNNLTPTKEIKNNPDSIIRFANNNKPYLSKAEQIDIPAPIQGPKGQINNPSSSFFYEIKRGDTLSNIAAKNNKRLSEVLELNPSIKNPNKIAEAQVIKLGNNNTKQLANDNFRIDNEVNAKKVMSSGLYASKDIDKEVSDYFKKANPNIMEPDETGKYVEKSITKDMGLFSKNNNLSSLTPSTAKEIVLGNRLDEIKNKDLANEVGKQIFETGNDVSQKRLQEDTNKIAGANLKIDGWIGDKTLNTVNSLDDITSNAIKEELQKQREAEKAETEKQKQQEEAKKEKEKQELEEQKKKEKAREAEEKLNLAQAEQKSSFSNYSNDNNASDQDNSNIISKSFQHNDENSNSSSSWWNIW